ncbi:MAG: hypothetical protein LBL04_00700 [Bacteroidales bacterium]|nr:hypothetical protein [Bacteroidales bacterium]
MKKKVRTQVLSWFQAHIFEFDFSMEAIYHISGISRQADRVDTPHGAAKNKIYHKDGIAAASEPPYLCQ